MRTIVIGHMQTIAIVQRESTFYCRHLENFRFYPLTWKLFSSTTGTSFASTPSILIKFPMDRRSRKLAISSSLPWSSSSTHPSQVFFTQPVSCSSRAKCCARYLSPTPCTIPVSIKCFLIFIFYAPFLPISFHCIPGFYYKTGMAAAPALLFYSRILPLSFKGRKDCTTWIIPLSVMSATVFF